MDTVTCAAGDTAFAAPDTEDAKTAAHRAISAAHKCKRDAAVALGSVVDMLSPASGIFASQRDNHAAHSYWKAARNVIPKNRVASLGTQTPTSPKPRPAR